MSLQSVAARIKARFGRPSEALIRVAELERALAHFRSTYEQDQRAVDRRLDDLRAQIEAKKKT